LYKLYRNGKKSGITVLGILFELCEQRADVFAKGRRRNVVNWDMMPCSREDIYQTRDVLPIASVQEPGYNGSNTGK
jgi:hypothetical protein